MMGKSTKPAVLIADHKREFDEHVDPDELLRPAQVAKDLGVTPNTLAIWRYYDRGPNFLKIGRQVRYRRQSIEDFKKACEHQCNPSVEGMRRR